MPEALIRKQGWFIGSGLRIFYSSILLVTLHMITILALVVSSDRSSYSDDGVLYIQATLSDFHSVH